MSSLLVCDLDGTLLGDSASLRELLGLLRKPRAPVLAFATGRQGYSAMSLLGEWDVKQGAYLIAGVGTELYRRIGTRWLPVAAWPEMHAPWDAALARRRLAALPGLEPQEIAVSSAYKLSYTAPAAMVPQVSNALNQAGLAATVVHSHTNMLDVLPPGVDKGSAVCWLARRLAMPFERLMTCGNTANDLSMLRLPCPSIVVGGCEAELREAAPFLPETFSAARPCAAGIIEGLRFFGWLNGAAWA